ncbi:MAG: glucose-1-phosphate cytidylyltransferase [Luminiphilus sp.]|nr:glucose-1-phosphate cytidylyltransferase [Luminiphilus sp.]
MVSKAVILAGGLGTRLAEETDLRPKPMIDIGGMPILWHVMKNYSAHNINEFIICCGYKGYVVKEYFANYFLHMSDVTFDMTENKMEVHQNKAEPWKVTLVDTGEHSMTGGRLRRVREFLDNEEAFCFTYGDGVSDIDVTALVAFHYSHGGLATVTATRPAGRFGALILTDDSAVKRFEEKPLGDQSWINGGFFVLDPTVIDYIPDDTTSWEEAPLMRLTSEGQLHAYKHRGFWQPMDTLRDKKRLNHLWNSGQAPWKTWD